MCVKDILHDCMGLVGGFSWDLEKSGAQFLGAICSQDFPPTDMQGYVGIMGYLMYD